MYQESWCLEPRHNPSAQTPKLYPILTPESVYLHTNGIGGESMTNMQLEARTKDTLQEHLWWDRGSCTARMGRDNWNSRFCPIEFHLNEIPPQNPRILYTHPDIAVVPSPHLALFGIIAVACGHFLLLFWLMPFFQPLPKI